MQDELYANSYIFLTLHGPLPDRHILRTVQAVPVRFCATAVALPQHRVLQRCSPATYTTLFLC